VFPRAGPGNSPAGGQGMNTGMQDAFNLAWKLALVQKGQGRAEPLLLQSYSVERSAVGDQVLRNAERFTTLATLRSPGGAVAAQPHRPDPGGVPVRPRQGPGRLV